MSASEITAIRTCSQRKELGPSLVHCLVEDVIRNIAKPFEVNPTTQDQSIDRSAWRLNDLKALTLPVLSYQGVPQIQIVVKPKWPRCFDTFKSRVKTFPIREPVIRFSESKVHKGYGVRPQRLRWFSLDPHLIKPKKIEVGKKSSEKWVLELVASFLSLTCHFDIP